jgi:hypothetical protein
MHLKSWQIFLIGLGVVFALGFVFLEPFYAGSLVSEYVIWGGIGLAVYTISKKKLSQKIAIGLGITTSLIFAFGLSILRTISTN